MGMALRSDLAGYFTSRSPRIECNPLSTFNVLNSSPVARRSDMKSIVHSSFGRCGIGSGNRDSLARFFRRRQFAAARSSFGRQGWNARSASRPLQPPWLWPVGRRLGCRVAIVRSLFGLRNWAFLRRLHARVCRQLVAKAFRPLVSYWNYLSFFLSLQVRVLEGPPSFLPSRIEALATS